LHGLIGDNRRHLATVKTAILQSYIATYCAISLICRVFFSCCDSVASPQAAALCTDEAGNIYSVLLLICRVFFFCCDSYDNWRHLATAMSALLRRYIAVYSALLLICRVFFSFCSNVASPQATVLCADGAGNVYSALLLICRVFVSCYDSVAWPQAAAWETA